MPNPERSRHLSVHVERSAADVYAFAADPLNLPRWAAGLGGAVVQEDGRWFVDTPQGRNELVWTERNRFGVLDHEVLTAGGLRVQVPLRVVPDGEGAEVVLTLRRAPGVDDAEFEDDAARITADLERLKEVVEARD